jgi:tetratricopeptide (TPR) repeat protein
MKSALKPKLILQLRPISAEASANLAGLVTKRSIRRIAVAGFAVAALFVATPIAAQQMIDRDRCINADNTSAPDAVIEACATLIEAYARGQIEPSDAATAYVGRGNAYAVMHERNLATADYDRAIAIYPYLKLGQFERAIADYDAALTRSPRQAGSLYGRGIAKLRAGDGAGGRADIAAARAIDPDIVEIYIHHYKVKE